MSSGGTSQIKSGLKSGDQVYVEIDTGPRSSSTDGGSLVQTGNLPANGVFVPGNGPPGGVYQVGGGK
jgi:hypothetical protein